MLVEKPGVTYLDHHGSGGATRGASPEFRSEHTLDRWAAAIDAAVEAARALPEVAPGPILLIGHSEGGISAAAVAAINDRVTHVAILSGGGPTQFYDLMDGAKKGYFFGADEDSAERVNYLLGEWKNILADPDNPDSLFFGHPWRRWSSFLKSSTLEDIEKSRARIYVAQGTEDDAVAPESFDFLKAGLMARNRDAIFDLVEGANHSFAFADRREDGWTLLMRRVVSWFLETGQ
jgi:pimeloyl-ACP methyl ester carboxylesterase